MSIISDAVYFKLRPAKHGFFSSDRIDEGHAALLKRVTQRQRRKYRSHGQVPLPVLRVFWDVKFLPGDIAPSKGMKVKQVLDVLEKAWAEEPDPGLAEDYMWLYQEIVKGELHPPRAVKAQHPAACRG